MEDDVALSPDEIKQILDLLEAAGWDEARITVGDSTLAVSRGSGTGRAFSVSAAPVERAPAQEGATEQAAAAPVLASAAPSGHVITSPTVGVFWRAPEPGAPPFVELGAAVEPGTNLCIVEVMKLMNYVTTEVAGVVAAIHVANGDAVMKGTPLFSIDIAS
jgi:acetyl-CoA carboxylase biotin carboxyl carrier protein